MEGRRLICYILRHDLGMKFQNIAKCLNLNHSSVIYHCKTLQGYLDNKDSKAIKDYNFVISSLNADNTTIDFFKNIKEIEKIKEVEFARAEKKKSKSGNEYLNVTFKLVDEFWPQSMPFMIGMNGPAGIIAKKKWKACAANGTPVPYTIERGEELINDEGCFDHIKRITVRKEGKYWNVVSVYY